MVAAEEPRLNQGSQERIKKLAGYKVAVAGAMVGLRFMPSPSTNWNPVVLAILGLAAGIVLRYPLRGVGLVFSFRTTTQKTGRVLGRHGGKLLICSVLGWLVS